MEFVNHYTGLAERTTISNPHSNYLNPNYTEEDYQEFVNKCMQNEFTIDGVDYSSVT